jgi:hypothetical protein
MTKRKRWALVIVLLAVLGCAAFGAALYFARSDITPANAAKLREGMTLAEVEQVLGGPARFEYDGLVTPDADWKTINKFSERRVEGVAMTKRWNSASVSVDADFDRDGRLIASYSLPCRPAEENLIDRLRRWLGL